MRLLPIAVAAAAVAMPAGAQAAAPLAALKQSCKPRTSPDGARYRICTAPVKTFDGTPIDVTLTLPPKATT